MSTDHPARLAVLVTIVNGVFTHRVDDTGKLKAMRGFWELPAVKVFPRDAA